MSEPVVFDAHTFLRAIAFDEDEPQVFEQEHGALETLRAYCTHQLLLTPGIRREYERELREFRGAPLLSRLQELAAENKLINSELRGRGAFPSMPGRHRAYFQDSVAANVRYLVTPNPRWANNWQLRTDLNDRGVRLVEPWLYAQEVKSLL